MKTPPRSYIWYVVLNRRAGRGAKAARPGGLAVVTGKGIFFSIGRFLVSLFVWRSYTPKRLGGAPIRLTARVGSNGVRSPPHRLLGGGGPSSS